MPLRNQHLIRSTLPTSWGFKPLNSVPNTANPKGAFGGAIESEYIGNFEFVGTIDSAPYLCVPAALAWRKALGGEKLIRDYCTQLAQEAGRLVAKALGTEVLENQSKTLGQCCMSMVRLPIEFEEVKVAGGKKGVGEEKMGALVNVWLQKTMADKGDTFLQTIFYGGSWWARFSGQVYLELQDFEGAVPALKELCERASGGEWTEILEMEW